MSDTHGHGTGNRNNGRKSPGYEYWSRRPGPTTPGKLSKRTTHKIERMREREDLLSKLVKEAQDLGFYEIHGRA